MTPIRAVLAGILAVALGLGALMWWLQTRALYAEVRSVAAGEVGVTRPDGSATALAVTDASFLDSDSSPIRHRACLILTDPASADALPAYEAPTPLIAPDWFDCFDARAIGEALERGEARAVLAQPLVDLPYGVDRVMAAYPDGRAFLWQQMNRCGRALYDGDARPEGCPEPPDGQRFTNPPGET